MSTSVLAMITATIGVAGTLSAAIFTQIIQRKAERERRRAEDQRQWNQERLRAATDIVTVATEIELLCEGITYDRHASEPDHVNEIGKRLPRLRSLVAEFGLIADRSLAKMAHGLMEWGYQAAIDVQEGNGYKGGETLKEAREHFQAMFWESLENGTVSLEPWHP
ncbi:hypothetical protein [Actinomadura macra]|uniref:hypothetical protein n=1 Tax=Actinomadura macra TaxID=46164 RepID=UPI0012F759A7|nr:hypothetical protein [Actinomadura macra]